MNSAKRWRVVGLNFDYFHIDDLLRMVFTHPRAEIAGICDRDPTRMQEAVRNFRLPPERVFTDARACLEATRPDMLILHPPRGRTRRVD